MKDGLKDVGIGLATGFVLLVLSLAFAFGLNLLPK